MTLSFLFKKKTITIVSIVALVLIFPALVVFGPGCDMLESIAQSNKDSGFGKSLQLRVAYIHRFFLRYERAFNSFNKYIDMVLGEERDYAKINYEDSALANAFLVKAEMMEQMFNEKSMLRKQAIDEYQEFLDIYEGTPREEECKEARDAIRRITYGSALK